MNLIEELSWRGMIHDMTPGAEKKLLEGPVTVYAGFDPSAPSLQVGNLLPIMLLLHFQKAGHTPIALLGGATGLIGDPSFKSQERNLQSLETVRHNLERFRVQMSRFLDFDSAPNAASMVDNYDWFKDIGFLEFLRDIGKHITVNYMLAKDSVKGRLESGLSFTEFSYQLMQAFDYYHLSETRGCTFQLGGSDQWGNITTGTELIRRMSGKEAYALTCPLLTKADGSKFGKSEAGERIWLDRELMSPYRFYQFWLNCTDEDAKRFIRIFTLLSKEEIEEIERTHAAAPHERALQKSLARDITIRVHSEEDWTKAVQASEILFGRGTTEALRGLSDDDFAMMFEGVPQAQVARSEIEAGISITALLVERTNVFPSKGELRRTIQSGGLSVNKERISDAERMVTTGDLLNGKFLLVQKGKKSYHVVKVG